MATNGSGTPRGAHARHAAPEGQARRTRPSDSLGTISADQGARVTNRASTRGRGEKDRARAARRTGAAASETRLRGSNRPQYGQTSGKVKRPLELRRVLPVIGAALLVLLAIGFVVRCTAPKPGAADSGASGQGQQADAGTSTPAREVPEGSVVYHDVVFSLQQGEDGKWLVMADDGTNPPAATFGVDNEAVKLLLFNNILIVPENTPEGWDVAAYALGADALPTFVMGADGNPVKGSGTVTDAVIDGSTLKVTDSTGAVTDVALE